MNPGKWEVAVIPENKKGQIFWKKTIYSFTHGVFDQFIKDITYDEYQPKRIIFTFDTNKIIKQKASKFIVRPAIISDIPDIVSLSKRKRLEYEKAQPKFWRYAGPIAEQFQAVWFRELLLHKDYLMFTAQNANNEILGFVIGQLISAPEVYNPGGLTLMIDDFCMQSENLWDFVGKKLLKQIKIEAKIKNATQILVVCGAHDILKQKFLLNHELIIASEWFVGEIL